MPKILENDFPAARLAVAFDQLSRDESASWSHRLAALRVRLRPGAAC